MECDEDILREGKSVSDYRIMETDHRVADRVTNAGIRFLCSPALGFGFDFNPP